MPADVRKEHEEIRKVERAINRKIREDLPLQEYRDIPIAEAKALRSPRVGVSEAGGERWSDPVLIG